MRQTLFCLCIFVLISSCSEETETPSDIGYAYFPLELGLTKTFQVDETTYLFNGDIVTTSYQLREDIVDSFISGQDTSFVIYRYQREDENSEWEFKETWQARRNDQQAIIVEGNTPFLKMTFPVFDNKSWDGNRLNAAEEDLYEADSLGVALDLQGEIFDNTITVIQNDNQDFIVEQDRRYEVYAEGLGLVYRSELLLDYCTAEDCLGQQIIESGREMEQRLIFYEN